MPPLAALAGRDLPLAEFTRDIPGRPARYDLLSHPPHLWRGHRIRGQYPAAIGFVSPVPKWDSTPAPPSRKVEFVFCLLAALSHTCPLEFSEHNQDVAEHAAHGGREVKVLRDADDCLAVVLAPLYEHGEIEQRTAQPVQLGNDQAIPQRHLRRLGKPRA